VRVFSCLKLFGLLFFPAKEEGRGAAETTNLTVLEPIRTARLPCSPPIPPFPPIREKGGYRAGFSKESLPKETTSELAGLPSPKLGEGWGLTERLHNCHFEPKARNLKFQFPSVLRGEAVETAGFTVLEPIRTASLPCSPPIPSFPPIREVLAHSDAAASKLDDHGNWTGRKGAVREDAHREVPLSQIGGRGREGWGLEEPAMRLSFQAEGTCHFEPVTQLSFRAEGEKS